MFKINTKRLPITPGIYFFRDKRGRILYIGKAVNLKNRLASYFKPQLGGPTAKWSPTRKARNSWHYEIPSTLARGAEPRTEGLSPAIKTRSPLVRGLIQVAAKVSWQETNSEIEALILESQLIKKHRPPFNVALRDDKQYFYVRFTNEKLPKIFLTHQPEADSRKPIAAIAGPFTDGSALKTVLKLLRRIFPYCTCKQKHNNFCLNYHIGKCLGFCCLKNAESRIKYYELRRKEYKKNIKAIREILSGRKSSLVKKLKKEMETLAHKSKFEKAIDLRNKIEKLEKIFQNAQILLNTKYKILDTKSNQKQVNPLTILQSVLNLPRFPHRIEGYDVSNIQGQFATGAMVVFNNGKPDKKEYRKFKIRSSDQIFRHRKTRGLAMTLSQKPNDIAMLKEVLTRRFNHPEWPWPDLVIVDGGKAQLNIAVKVISGHRKTRGLAMTKSSIPIIALTKNKQHRGSHIYLWSSSRFYSSQSDDYKIEDPRFPLESGQDHRLKNAAIPLKKLPERVRNLILQVDAEAHRFAIGYYRKLHRLLN